MIVARPRGTSMRHNAFYRISHRLVASCVGKLHKTIAFLSRSPARPLYASQNICCIPKLDSFGITTSGNACWNV